MSKLYTMSQNERGVIIEEAKAYLVQEEVPVTPSTLANYLDCSEGTVNRWVNEIGKEARKGVRARLDPDTRKAGILAAAMDEALDVGFHNLTRRGIAARAEVSEPLVNKYLGTLPQLRRTIMRQAVKHECLGIIAQGIVSKNQHALKASPELQKKALSLFK